VILTAYFDESGTHDGSPTAVVCGAMATSRQWERVEFGLRKLKRKYGFRILHATDLRTGSGDFHGWSQQKIVDLLGDVGFLLGGNAIMEYAVCTVDVAAFQEEYRGEWIKKPRLDTQYGLAFRSCLVHLGLEIERRLGHHRSFSETRLHCVIEAGHKNAGDAQRIFHEMKKDLERHDMQMFGDFTLATKHERDPLMVADFIAYTSYKTDLAIREHGMRSVFPDAIAPIREGAITRIQYAPGSLAKVRTALIEKLERRRNKQFNGQSVSSVHGPRRIASEDEEPAS